MEDFVAQLKEQISALSVFLEEERRAHKETEIKLRLQHAQRSKEASTEHQKEVAQLEKRHEHYVALLKSHHKSTLTMLEKTFQNQIKRLRNEYALLQAALRNYKDLVQSDIGKVWADKEEFMRREYEAKASDMVAAVRLEDERQFEIEREKLLAKYEVEVDNKVREAVQRAVAGMVQQSRTSDDETFSGEDHGEQIVVARNESHLCLDSDRSSSQNSISLSNTREDESTFQPSAGSFDSPTNADLPCDESSLPLQSCFLSDNETSDEGTVPSSLNTRRDSDLDELVLGSNSDDESG